MSLRSSRLEHSCLARSIEITLTAAPLSISGCMKVPAKNIGKVILVVIPILVSTILTLCGISLFLKSLSFVFILFICSPDLAFIFLFDILFDKKGLSYEIFTDIRDIENIKTGTIAAIGSDLIRNMEIIIIINTILFFRIFKRKGVLIQLIAPPGEDDPSVERTSIRSFMSSLTSFWVCV